MYPVFWTTRILGTYQNSVALFLFLPYAIYTTYFFSFLLPPNWVSHVSSLAILLICDKEVIEV